jgi:hypothetical protein
MIKTFTQTDLIRYLYRETTDQETKEISNALICDSELQSQYAELSSLIKSMDGAQIEPSKVSVQNILNYAKRAAGKKTKASRAHS